MYRNGIAPSRLPTFLLPCPHCGHRMAITSVAPARFDAGSAANDLEDVTLRLNATLSHLTALDRLEPPDPVPSAILAPDGA